MNLFNVYREGEGEGRILYGDLWKDIGWYKSPQKWTQIYYASPQFISPYPLNPLGPAWGNIAVSLNIRQLVCGRLLLITHRLPVNDIFQGCFVCDKFEEAREAIQKERQFKAIHSGVISKEKKLEVATIAYDPEKVNLQWQNNSIFGIFKHHFPAIFPGLFCLW